MGSTARILLALGLELAGLAALSCLVILLAALHVFSGAAPVDPLDALLFALVSASMAAGALIAYALLRIASLKAENGRLYRAATRDGLTGVLNRAAFTSEAQRMIASMGRRREDPSRLSLLIVDADHFKRINDRLGHDVGDTALVAIARALAGSLRREDLVGRIGGEEFAVLLRHAGPKEAAIVAERLRQTVNRLVVGPRTSPVRLSVSLGGVGFDRAVPFEIVYRQADANLYKAKRAGRNRAEIAALSAMGPARRTERMLSRAANAGGGPRPLLRI